MFAWDWRLGAKHVGIRAMRYQTGSKIMTCMGLIDIILQRLLCVRKSIVNTWVFINNMMADARKGWRLNDSEKFSSMIKCGFVKLLLVIIAFARRLIHQI